jgi:hypothetical protein
VRHAQPQGIAHDARAAELRAMPGIDPAVGLRLPDRRDGSSPSLDAQLVGDPAEPRFKAANGPMCPLPFGKADRPAASGAKRTSRSDRACPQHNYFPIELERRGDRRSPDLVRHAT